MLTAVAQWHLNISMRAVKAGADAFVLKHDLNGYAVKKADLLRVIVGIGLYSICIQAVDILCLSIRVPKRFLQFVSHGAFISSCL